MRIVEDKISCQELKKMSEKMFNSIVKAVVDIEKGIMVDDIKIQQKIRDVVAKLVSV